MYLKKIKINNIKCFSELEISFFDVDKPRLWTNIVGPNGIGKSTLLQAIGAIVAGPDVANSLIPYERNWISIGKSGGTIEAEIVRSRDDVEIDQRTPGKPYSVRLLATPYRIPLFTMLGDETATRFEFWLEGLPKGSTLPAELFGHSTA